MRRAPRATSINKDRRTLLALALLACFVAGAPLLLSAPATAHVVPKYKREYANTLLFQGTAFAKWLQSARATVEDVKRLCDTLEPLIGKDDPAAKAQLLAGRQYALTASKALEEQIPQWTESVAKSSQEFQKKGLRWFRAKADRRKFARDAARMDVSLYLVVTGAQGRLRDAYLDLSKDPPAIDAAWLKVGKADEYTSTAETSFSAAMERLQALK